MQYMTSMRDGYGQTENRTNKLRDIVTFHYYTQDYLSVCKLPSMRHHSDDLRSDSKPKSTQEISNLCSRHQCSEINKFNVVKSINKEREGHRPSRFLFSIRNVDRLLLNDDFGRCVARTADVDSRFRGICHLDARYREVFRSFLDSGC